jgi:hypothetical protein
VRAPSRRDRRLRAPAGKRSINSAAAAFEIARFRVELWPVPDELSGALVKALADEWPSVRRDAAYALGIVLTHR